MPFYEFYCSDCHTVFRFFSRRVDTQTRPACPKCGRPEIQRRMSTFAISRGRDAGDGDGLPDMDEARLEQAFASMAGDLDSVDENDPKAAARMMRKLFDATGVRLTRDMEEAIHRMEAGEDPDKVEAEMGDVLENADPFAAQGRPSLKDIRRLLPPTVDETLYEL